MKGLTIATPNVVASTQTENRLHTSAKKKLDLCCP
jgi:hypothetical protein